MKNGSDNGQTLIKMFEAGTQFLKNSVQEINAINVFPVPDGDTGTNMLLTMQSAIEEAYKKTDIIDVATTSQTIAHGALMGARGNSGVILSQFWRGFAKGFQDKETFTGIDLAHALEEASKAAYDGVIHPVEGTMLTVIKDTSIAAASATSDSSDLLTIMEIAVDAAYSSVERTPDLLPMLREAGVVDAGGQGIYVLLYGVLNYLRGEYHKPVEQMPEFSIASQTTGSKIASSTDIELPWGYCINFLLEGDLLHIDRIKRGLNRLGQSVVVAGTEDTVRVHIHSFNPGRILSYALHLGTLHQIDINNMDDQYSEYMRLRKEKSPQLKSAAIAVASGDGFFKIFDTLGASMIVPGGQTMNPSVRQLLRAVEEAPSNDVLLLPNNKNIILTANQVDALSEKSVRVIKSTTVPQGIAALLAFNSELSLEDNYQAMNQAITSPQTIEITKAVRKTQINRKSIKKGQYIAVINNHEIITDDNNRLFDLVFEALVTTKIEKAELVTVYYGSDTEAIEAEDIAQNIRNTYKVEVEVVNGGQPHYNYILSLE
jgi:DAK2 domain fusion protein YloV